MPYEMKVDGMAEISRTLDQLGEKAEATASRALYKGAGIMAQKLKEGAESIKTAPFKFARQGETRLPSPEEKEVILSAGGIGVARFKKNGGDVDTSVGYGNTGYADLNGKRVPIPLIANSINSGTSFMPKQPFVRKAANSGGKEALQAMKESIEADFNAITK